MMRLTIGRKLVGGFMIVAILMIVLGGLSYHSMNSLMGTFNQLVDVRVRIMSNAEQIQAAGSQQNDYMREYFLTQNPGSVQRMQASNTRIVELVNETLPLVTKQEDKDRFQRLLDMTVEYKGRVDSIMLLPYEQALKEANFNLYGLATQIVILAESMAQEQLQLMNEEKQAVQNDAKTDAEVSFIISIVAIVVSIGIGVVVSLFISRPIRSITDIAKHIAGGDLTDKKLHIRTKDEIQELAAAFEEMLRQLRSIIGKVEQGADHMAISSKMLTASAGQTSMATMQITEAAQEVASGSELQVRGAEDSARAMEEMTQGIVRIAESSSVVFEGSIAARNQAEEGDQAAQRAVLQMSNIYETSSRAADSVKKLGERSGEIGEIIEVITGIASQTNLLALNASIEAARAGEHGRGFMVVAAEVKKLALQSEGAAKQISDLIREVQSDTETAVKGMNDGMVQAREGLEVVQKAGQAFSEIREAVNRVSMQIEEVSATAEEISAGSEEVAASVEETSRIAKQSADKVHLVAATSEEQLASMKEIASSAATLSTMAEELQQAVAKFKL